MYLALILIVVAIIVFYNEFNTKMNIAEYALLAIALIAIIRSSYNYIQIGGLFEGFNNARPSTKRHHNNKNKENKLEEILNSDDSDEYLDTDNSNNTQNNNEKKTNSFENVNKSDEGIKHINNLLGKSHFDDVSTPTESQPSPTENNTENDIKSVFVPQVLIGNGSDSGFGSTGIGGDWRKSFQADGMTFNDTMKPTKNLWGDDHGYYDQWTQSMDAYNKGRWNPNQYKKPSDYIDYYNPAKYGTSTPDSQDSDNKTKDDYGKEKKLCGGYDNLDVDKDGNLVVADYKYAKKYFPGYTYIPPEHWDVPQKRAGVCRQNSPNVHKLTGLVDRGLPLNVLELNPDGNMADTEDTVQLTNVGSMMPKFKYVETPFSRPYV